MRARQKLRAICHLHWSSPSSLSSDLLSRRHWSWLCLRRLGYLSCLPAMGSSNCWDETSQTGENLPAWAATLVRWSNAVQSETRVALFCNSAKRAANFDDSGLFSPILVALFLVLSANAVSLLASLMSFSSFLISSHSCFSLSCASTMRHRATRVELLWSCWSLVALG